MDADELMMAALDAGAEDFSEEEDSYEVITAPDDFSAVREALEKAGIPTMILDGDGCNPANTSDGQVSTRLQAFVEMLEEGKEEKDL